MLAQAKSLIRWYKLLIIRPNEVIFDLDTRWDVEKEQWASLWAHHISRRVHQIMCRFDRHGDFVNVVEKKAICIWCRRVTNKMPKWWR